MTLVFVDTKVLISAEDGAEADKQHSALDWIERLWRARSGRLSTQVLNEFYVNVTRKLKPAMPQGDARARVRRYAAGWNPWQIDHATVETAWAMEARHGLQYWDCLVLAAAQHSGCTLVLSEDMQHEGRYGAVQVINPFLASIDEVLGPDER
ncbi:MAG: PIN domain-containing protein [Ottowia sp.]|uniref:PIN domain-containing protein n=1 Tax=Ottowia sp. TaxID=1898956 RepID=UPI001B743D2B|nr:PIN domain-containing protein [Ottowia sp.]MBP8929497.1 PIN domain-containing protein [Ottowia sp.]MBP9524405.1 PIN domain-containing protein [Ottowia sp.]HRM55613.1 PIN domain-containing protein [Ottowia sp.]HRN07739.1 PIN domain-containing protein [Ottowia sp.]